MNVAPARYCPAGVYEIVGAEEGSDVGTDWRLTLLGPSRRLMLDRATLERMPQHSAELPIACVEGWSTTQTWSGVRLRDLAVLAGLPNARATVRSLGINALPTVWLIDQQGRYPRLTCQRRVV